MLAVGHESSLLHRLLCYGASFSMRHIRHSVTGSHLTAALVTDKHGSASVFIEDESFLSVFSVHGRCWKSIKNEPWRQGMSDWTFFFWCQLTWVVLDKRPLDGLLLLLSFLASFKLSLKTAALFVDYFSGSGRAIGLACVSLFLNNNFWTEWHLMYLAWFILTYHTLHWKVDIIG